MHSTLLIADLAKSIYKLPAEQWQAYTCFGLPSVVTLAKISFNAQKFELGFYSLGNGYRCYSPSLLRFFSPDKFSPFKEGGFNAYAYCSAEPTNRQDDAGTMWSSIKSLLTSKALKTTDELLEVVVLPRNPKGLDFLFQHEPDIAKNIIKNLDSRSLVALNRTSKSMYSITNKHSDELFLRHLPLDRNRAISHAEKAHYYELNGVMPSSANNRGYPFRRVQYEYPYDQSGSGPRYNANQPFSNRIQFGPSYRKELETKHRH